MNGEASRKVLLGSPRWRRNKWIEQGRENSEGGDSGETIEFETRMKAILGRMMEVFRSDETCFDVSNLETEA